MQRRIATLHPTTYAKVISTLDKDERRAFNASHLNQILDFDTLYAALKAEPSETRIKLALGKMEYINSIVEVIKVAQLFNRDNLATFFNEVTDNQWAFTVDASAELMTNSLGDNRRSMVTSLFEDVYVSTNFSSVAAKNFSEILEKLQLLMDRNLNVDVVDEAGARFIKANPGMATSGDFLDIILNINHNSPEERRLPETTLAFAELHKELIDDESLEELIKYINPHQRLQFLQNFEQFRLSQMNPAADEAGRDSKYCARGGL